MNIPASKEELLNASDEAFKKLNDIISSLTEKELATEFNFGDNKKERHWKRDKNLRDVLVHLYEWHMLMIECIKANKNGINKPFLPPPYNWKTYGDMNDEFWKKHQSTSLSDAKKLFSNSHSELMTLTEELTDEQIFTNGEFQWAGKHNLASYFISNTSSHYNWAIKKLKSHIKNCRQS